MCNILFLLSPRSRSSEGRQRCDIVGIFSPGHKWRCPWFPFFMSILGIFVIVQFLCDNSDILSTTLSPLRYINFIHFSQGTLVPLTSGIFPLGKKGPNEFLPFYLRCEAHRQNDWDDVTSLDSRLWTDRSGPRPLIIPAPMSLMSSCQHFEYFLSLMGWKFSGLDSDWMML